MSITKPKALISPITQKFIVATTKARIVLLSIVILALFTISLSETLIAAAQESYSGITLRANTASDGYFKYGEWLPIFVEIENSGPDIEATVQVRIPVSNGATVYNHPVSLPSRSRKRIVTYVVPNNFSRQLNVQLVAANGEQIASQAVSVSPQAPITYLISLLSPERGALTLIRSVDLPGQKRPILIIDTALDEIPEKYEGLRSFDLLVLNNIDTSAMTQDQSFALETWVQRGGRLVIGGGAGAARTISGLPEALITLVPKGNSQVNELPGLAAFVGIDHPILVPGPFLISTGDLQAGIILASHDTIPLIVEKSYGNGFVDFIGLDLSASPFDAWSGTPIFWENIISSGSAYPEWLPQDVSIRQQAAGQMPYALSNLPVLDLPSAQSLALLLSLYIMVVGPLNFIVLRWRKRLHWAWITIPVITIIFSAGAFGLGYALHGTDIFINKIAILELGESGRAHANNYIGVFSPSQQTYEIEVHGGGLISPLETYLDPWSSIAPQGISASSRDAHIIQGDPAYIRGLSVDQWSLQSYLVEGIQVPVGRIEADLLLENDHLTGELRNQTDQLLQDATIILGKQFSKLGDIPPGEIKSIDMQISELAAPVFGPPISYLLMEEEFNRPGSSGINRQAEVKRAIIESVFERTAINSPATTGMPLLLGWLNEAPPEVRITGEIPSQQTTALLFKSLPYRLPEQGYVSIPTGLIPGKLAQISPGGGPCGESGNTAVYLNPSGEAQFEFRLPTILRDLLIENLKLNITTDSPGLEMPDVSFHNWKSDEWITYTSNNGVNLIANANELVRGDGLISLEISKSEENALSGCYFLTLGLEGRR